ncbi:MAG: hypothetical protein BGN96_10355 [Bacteroidales bacterium 45-6]|nr:MAG: hypothetical protein BGN96_10355 [Bacteroidales bacterium 45-6]
MPVVEWFEPIMNALLGYPVKMIHNIPIWFFMCLFVVEMFFYILFRRKNRFVWMIIAGILLLIFVAWANSALNPYVLPFTIPTALYAVVFYAFGYLLKQSKALAVNNIIIVIVEALIVLLVAYFNGKVAMHRNIYGNPLLFFAGGIAGAFFIIHLSRYLSNLFKSNKLVCYLGANTLVICGFHLQTFSVIKAIVIYVLGLSLSVFSQKIGLNMLFSAVSILLCIPVIWFINRYLPFIAGKSNLKK